MKDRGFWDTALWLKIVGISTTVFLLLPPEARKALIALLREIRAAYFVHVRRQRPPDTWPALDTIAQARVTQREGRVATHPVRIFCSYSHRDDRWKQRLDEHFSLLRREGIVDYWHDRRIGPRDEWERAIDERLAECDIVLLLVSPSFLNSDYCYEVEMSRALERHHDGTARVIPVILRPCDWESAPFAKLQALPSDGKPVMVQYRINHDLQPDLRSIFVPRTHRAIRK
jgi:hypothetical protein